jgi:hypothetical protein
VKQYTGGGMESDPTKLKALAAELMGLNKQLMEAGIETFMGQAVG